MPRFCIVVPSHQSAATLGEAVESALSQNHRDFCVVVSDNRSDDGTAEVLNRFAASRLQVQLHDERLGKTANWNRAFSYAPDCEYLVNLHSDDRLNPETLNTLEAHSRRRKPVLIHGGFRVISYDGRVCGGVRRFPLSHSAFAETEQEILLLGNIVNVVGAAFRRDVFERVGRWPSRFTFFQDVELWHLLAEQGEVRYVSAHFGDYRDSPPGKNTLLVTVQEACTSYAERVRTANRRSHRQAALATLSDLVEISEQTARRGHPDCAGILDLLTPVKRFLGENEIRRFSRAVRQRRLRLQLGVKSLFTR